MTPDRMLELGTYRVWTRVDDLPPDVYSLQTADGDTVGVRFRVGSHPILHHVAVCDPLFGAARGSIRVAFSEAMAPDTAAHVAVQGTSCERVDSDDAASVRFECPPIDPSAPLSVVLDAPAIRGASGVPLDEPAGSTGRYTFVPADGMGIVHCSMHWLSYWPE